MKKFIIILVTCLISLFSFTACNVEVGEEVTGISFVHDVYYVDLGVETELEFKVFPESATGYVVSHDFSGNQDEQEYYTYTNGVIKVIDQNFSSISASVQINNLKDSCEVRLKEYPSQVKFDSSSIELYGGTATSLQLKGLFKEQLKGCENGQFNYKVESSNPSVVEVVDESRLMIKSTGRRGQSSIKVSVLNSKGQDLGLSASVNVVIKEYINQTIASIKGNLIAHNQTIDLSGAVGDKLSLDIKYFDQAGFLIEDATYHTLLSNENVIRINEVDEVKSIEILGEGKVNLTLQSEGVDAEGNPVIIKVLINVQISE